MPDKVGWLHQHYEAITVALGVVGLLIAWLQWRKRQRPTASMERSSADGAVMIAGSHNSITFAASHVPAKNEPDGIHLSSPNLVYAGAKRRPIYVGQWPTIGVCDPVDQEQQRNSIDALVLRFENRVLPGRKVKRALNVIAKMKLWHKDGRTWREVDYGVWVNSPCNSTTIGIGDTRELVLMCSLNGKVVTFEDKRSGGTRPYYSEPYSYFETPEIENYDRVEVVLIDQSTQASLRTHVRFWRDGKSFCTDI